MPRSPEGKVTSFSQPHPRLLSVQPITSEHPVNMENLPINGGSGQSFGYTLYETTITTSGVLTALVRDRGQVGVTPHPDAPTCGDGPTPRPPFPPHPWALPSAYWAGPPGPCRRCSPHLLLGQVFLNTFFLGILDYKKKTIIIPMVQVCPGGGPEGGRDWGLPQRWGECGSVIRDTISCSEFRENWGATEKLRGAAGASSGRPVLPTGVHDTEDPGGELREGQLRGQHRPAAQRWVMVPPAWPSPQEHRRAWGCATEGLQGGWGFLEPLEG